MSVMERKWTLRQRRDWLIEFLNLDLSRVLPVGIINLLYERKLFEDPYSEWAPKDIIQAYPDIEVARAKLKEDQVYLRDGLIRAIEAEDIETEGIQPEDVKPFWTIGPVEIMFYKAGGEIVESYRPLYEEMNTDKFRLNRTLGEVLQDFSPNRFALCKECRRFVFIKNKKNQGYCRTCSGRVRMERWRSTPLNREAEGIQRALRLNGSEKSLAEIRRGKESKED